MQRVVRTVLVWVLAIAMPLQGLAASAMLSCGPSHARMLQGLVSAAPAPGHAAHGGQAAHAGRDAAAAVHGAHAHAHADSADSVAATAQADGDAGHHPSPHHGKHSCSACAACCTALALPARFALLEVTRAVHAVRTALDAPVVSHQPETLDRPPRPHLA